jgi:hypothetical protein
MTVNTNSRFVAGLQRLEWERRQREYEAQKTDKEIVQ